MCGGKKDYHLENHRVVKNKREPLRAESRHGSIPVDFGYWYDQIFNVVIHDAGYVRFVIHGEMRDSREDLPRENVTAQKFWIGA